MCRLLLGIVLVATLMASLQAQQRPTLSPLTKSFVSVDSTVVALEHVRVIDGTGAAPKADQTILIENGVIRGIGPSSFNIAN